MRYLLILYNYQMSSFWVIQKLMKDRNHFWCVFICHCVREHRKQNNFTQRKNSLPARSYLNTPCSIVSTGACVECYQDWAYGGGFGKSAKAGVRRHLFRMLLNMLNNLEHYDHLIAKWIHRIWTGVFSI